MQAQYFHYKIIETKPLSYLEEFKAHRRLQVFYHKGCKCVECGIEATQLALGDGRGKLHWDVYTDDFYPLTVDHIVPKSKGGKDDLDNLQPMCCMCNWKKGNGDKPHSNVNKSKYPIPKHTRRANNRGFKDIEDIQSGMEVYRRINKKFVNLGIIRSVETNPHTNLPAVVVEGKPNSWYHISQIYIKNDQIHPQS